MKKFTLCIQCLALITLLNFSSCKKKVLELEPQATNSPAMDAQNINVVNGRLVFDNRRSFEEEISSSPSNNNSVARVAKKHEGFVSMWDYYKNKKSYNTRGRISSDTLPVLDDYLATILSPEGLIQIGKWIFKINLPEEKCYVLEESNIESYSDLINENVSNHVRVFPTSETVLDVLAEENSAKISKGLFCKESGARSENDKEKDISYELEGKVYKFKLKHGYQKAAIYFSLMSKVVFGNYHGGRATIIYTYKYKPKCRDEESNPRYPNYDATRNDPTGKETERSYTRRHYEGTRGLNKYYLTTSFDYSEYNAGLVFPVFPLDPISEGY